MSNEIIVALIGCISALIVAVIAYAAQIDAARIAKQKGSPLHHSRPLLLIGAGIITLLLSGLILGYFLRDWLPPSAVSDDELASVLLKISPEKGGIEPAAPWWHAVLYQSPPVHTQPVGYTVFSFPASSGCFGLAWNTVEGGSYTVRVFQREASFVFEPGGFYAEVCIDKTREITPMQAGKIQAAWLEKNLHQDGLWKVDVTGQ